MREIKFRGFNRKNGVWLYGFYLQNRGAHFVCPDEFADGKSWDDYEIDPETRGEYTGQKDKNGLEIYEGDVVATVMNGCRYVQEVVWEDITNGFSFRGHGCGPMFHKSSCMEVIGNIHDRSATQGDACQSNNPELLEQ